MDEARKRAYRVLLAAALLHLKWDLACTLGGLTWLRPRTLLWQSRAVRTAAFRAYAFHNLSITSQWDFRNLDEGQFWRDIDRFHLKCPQDRHRYREIFERLLAGGPINIVAPNAGLGTA